MGGGRNDAISRCIRHLKIADYMFLVRGPGIFPTAPGPRDRVAPVLIERKTMDDVAASIHDGRWEAQKRVLLSVRRMSCRAYSHCRLVYILEVQKGTGVTSRGFSRGLQCMHVAACVRARVRE